MDASPTTNKAIPLELSTVGDSDGVAFTQSSKFWFKDGNIILQVETTRFKVHQGVLARHSPIFDDLFSMPQPEAVRAESGTECPLLVIHDHPEDIEFALETFYGDRMCASNNLLALPHLVAMLRLGRKYNVEPFWKEADRRLVADYPSTWKDYVMLFSEGYSEIDIYGSHSLILDIAAPVYEHAPRIVLPAFYLDCLLKDVSSIMDAKLPPALLRTLLVGREAFSERGGSLLDMLHGRCPMQACMELRYERVHEWTKGRKLVEYVRTFSFDKDDWTKGVCPQCVARVNLEYPMRMQNIWDELPSMFNLPPWEELHAEYKSLMDAGL